MAFRLVDLHQRTQFFAKAPSSQSKNLIVPDQYQSIEAALLAAKPGDIIQIYPGKYDEKVTIPDQIHIEGKGVSSMIVIEHLSLNGTGIIQNVTIKSCVFNQASSRQASYLAVNCLKTEEKSMLLLENSTITSFQGQGDGFLDNNEFEGQSEISGKWVVEKCSFIDCVKNSSAFVFFDNCKLSSDDQDLLSVDQNSEIHLIRCTLIGNRNIKVGPGKTSRFSCVAIGANGFEGNQNVKLSEI